MDKSGWIDWFKPSATLLAALVAGAFLVWRTRHERPHDRLKTYVEIYNALPDGKDVKDRLWDEIELRLSLLTGRPSESKSAPIQADLRPSRSRVPSAVMAAGLLLLIGYVEAVPNSIHRPGGAESVVVAVLAIGVPLFAYVAYIRQGTKQLVQEEVVAATQIDNARDRDTKLEGAYASYLRGLGHDVQAYPEFHDVGGTRYRPDLFDATENEVIEIKANPARAGMARTQHLLDQLGRYRAVSGASKATLLAGEQPPPAFLDLMERNDIRVIWPEGEGFTGSPVEQSST